MSNVIDSTTTILSYFVSWISSMSISLVSNPVIQVIIGAFLSFFVFRLIINTIINFFCKEDSPKPRFHGTHTIENGVEYTSLTPIDEYNAGVEKFLSGYYDDSDYDYDENDISVSYDYPDFDNDNNDMPF